MSDIWNEGDAVFIVITGRFGHMSTYHFYTTVICGCGQLALYLVSIIYKLSLLHLL